MTSFFFIGDMMAKVVLLTILFLNIYSAEQFITPGGPKKEKLKIVKFILIGSETIECEFYYHDEEKITNAIEKYKKWKPGRSVESFIRNSLKDNKLSKDEVYNLNMNDCDIKTYACYFYFPTD